MANPVSDEAWGARTDLLSVFHFSRPHQRPIAEQRLLDNKKATIALDDALQLDREASTDILVATEARIRCHEHLEEVKQQHSQQLDEARGELDAKIKNAEKILHDQYNAKIDTLTGNFEQQTQQRETHIIQVLMNAAHLLSITISAEGSFDKRFHEFIGQVKRTASDAESDEAQRRCDLQTSSQQEMVGLLRDICTHFKWPLPENQTVTTLSSLISNSATTLKSEKDWSDRENKVLSEAKNLVDEQVLQLIQKFKSNGGPSTTPKLSTDAMLTKLEHTIDKALEAAVQQREKVIHDTVAASVREAARTVGVSLQEFTSTPQLVSTFTNSIIAKHEREAGYRNDVITMIATAAEKAGFDRPGYPTEAMEVHLKGFFDEVDKRNTGLQNRITALETAEQQHVTSVDHLRDQIVSSGQELTQASYTVTDTLDTIVDTYIKAVKSRIDDLNTERIAIDEHISKTIPSIADEPMSLDKVTNAMEHEVRPLRDEIEQLHSRVNSAMVERWSDARPSDESTMQQLDYYIDRTARDIQEEKTQKESSVEKVSELQTEFIRAVSKCCPEAADLADLSPAELCEALIVQSDRQVEAMQQLQELTHKSGEVVDNEVIAQQVQVGGNLPINERISALIKEFKVKVQTSTDSLKRLQNEVAAAGAKLGIAPPTSITSIVDTAESKINRWKEEHDNLENAVQEALTEQAATQGVQLSESNVNARLSEFYNKVATRLHDEKRTADEVFSRLAAYLNKFIDEAARSSSFTVPASTAKLPDRKSDETIMQEWFDSEMLRMHNGMSIWMEGHTGLGESGVDALFRLIDVLFTASMPGVELTPLDQDQKLVSEEVRTWALESQRVFENQQGQHALQQAGREVEQTKEQVTVAAVLTEFQLFAQEVFIVMQVPQNRAPRLPVTNTIQLDHLQQFANDRLDALRGSKENADASVTARIAAAKDEIVQLKKATVNSLRRSFMDQAARDKDVNLYGEIPTDFQHWMELIVFKGDSLIREKETTWNSICLVRQAFENAFKQAGITVPATELAMTGVNRVWEAASYLQKLSVALVKASEEKDRALDRAVQKYDTSESHRTDTIDGLQKHVLALHEKLGLDVTNWQPLGPGSSPFATVTWFAGRFQEVSSALDTMNKEHDATVDLVLDEAFRLFGTMVVSKKQEKLPPRPSADVIQAWFNRRREENRGLNMLRYERARMLETEIYQTGWTCFQSIYSGQMTDDKIPVFNRSLSQEYIHEWQAKLARAIQEENTKFVTRHYNNCVQTQADQYAPLVRGICGLVSRRITELSGILDLDEHDLPAVVLHEGNDFNSANDNVGRMQPWVRRATRRIAKELRTRAANAALDRATVITLTDAAQKTSDGLDAAVARIAELDADMGLNNI